MGLSDPNPTRTDQSDAPVRLLLDNARDVVFRLRLLPELELQYVSPSCETLTGYRPEEWHADAALVLRVVHPDDRHIVQSALEGTVESRNLTRWVRRDGRIVWVETDQRVLRDAEGRPEILEGVGRDVTERVLAEREARRARALFEGTFLQAPVGMGLTSLDPEGADRLVAVNDALCRFLGRSKEELLARPLEDFTHPDDRGKTVPLKERVLAGELDEFRIEKRYVRGDGSVVWGVLRGALVRDADGNVLHGIGHVEDITERVAHEAALRHRALHDALTDLPNRQLFLDRLDNALAQRTDTEVGLLFADLDDLKAINDAHGHAAGDAVIRELGRRFCLAVRPGDTVSRFAGDEYTILCPAVSGVATMERLGRRLLDALAEPVRFVDEEIALTVSIGATAAPPGTRSAGDLLADADTALLEAKRRGKACVHVYDECLGERAKDRRRREQEVRIAADAGQFELHYQPIAGLLDLRVPAVEALVRWRHPERGLQPPATFIELAEELGVIDRIGRWVVRRACRDAVAWGQERGRTGLRMAVNVSPRELVSGRLVGDVVAALEETGCDGTALCLEITESGIIDDPAAAMDTLARLKELGIRIALDDFGTGFSSLSQLATFPVDIVKLDRGFVTRLGAEDDRGAALVRAVVSMADALDLQLVAEGIETAEHRRLLIDLGCALGQGFLLGRPAPLADVRTQLHADEGRMRLRPPRQ